MKKALLYTFTFAALFAISQKVSAQAAIIALLFGDQVASEKFNISMELGANFSQFSDVPNSDQFKPDINFGIAGNIMLSEHWFLSPTAYFLSRRRLALNSYFPNTGNTTLDQEFANSDAELMVDFIDIPVLLAYETGNKKWRFGLGPQFSILKKSEIVVFGSDGDLVLDYKSNISSTDYGVLGSIGYAVGEARAGKGLYVQVRYYQGFANLLQELPNNNLGSYLSVHVSLPFITDELAKKNLKKK